MKPAERMLRLPVRPLADLLLDLHQLAQRQRQGEPVDIPRITLWLTHGHRAHGTLVAFAAREGLLLVKAADTLDATYLAVAEVKALTVHYHEDNLHVLSGGALPKLMGEAPGKLDLKRRLQNLVESLGVTGSVAFDQFPETEEARHLLGLALRDLEGVLRQVVADPEGRESFTQSVKEIQIRPNAQGPAVLRSAGVLTLLLGLEAGQVSVLSASKLKVAIEKLL